jgi:hypothetical protein
MTPWIYSTVRSQPLKITFGVKTAAIVPMGDG